MVGFVFEKVNNIQFTNLKKNQKQQQQQQKILI